jgi:hypothetical protein
MTIKNIRKKINDKAKAFGYYSEESLLEMDSVTYLSIIVELEEVFGVEFPDEVLASNAFKDMDTFTRVVSSLLPSGKSVFLFGKNIKIVWKKKFKFKEPDAKLFDNNRVLRIKSGCITLVGSTLLFPFMIYLFIHISRNYIPYYIDSIGNTLGIIGSVILIVVLLIFSNVITLITHELFHLLALPQHIKRYSEINILINLPIGIGCVYSECVSKRREIFISLCPLIFFSLILLVCRSIIGNLVLNWFLTMCVMINILGSFSDIVRATYIIVKAPKNSQIYLSYIFVPN